MRYLQNVATLVLPDVRQSISIGDAVSVVGPFEMSVGHARHSFNNHPSISHQVIRHRIVNHSGGPRGGGGDPLPTARPGTVARLPGLQGLEEQLQGIAEVAVGTAERHPFELACLAPHGPQVEERDGTAGTQYVGPLSPVCRVNASCGGCPGMHAHGVSLAESARHTKGDASTRFFCDLGILVGKAPQQTEIAFHSSNCLPSNASKRREEISRTEVG